MDPRNLLHVIEVASRIASVDGLGVQTLRHSAAVARLESGVHIKAVAGLLGPSPDASDQWTRADSDEPARVGVRVGVPNEKAPPGYSGKCL